MSASSAASSSASVMSASSAASSSASGAAAADESTAQRNATRAALVRGWIEESSAFGDREERLFELDAIVRLCDRHGIEFADFAALDEIILETGAAEQERRARITGGKRKLNADEKLTEGNFRADNFLRAVWNEGAKAYEGTELDEPLDGEAGSIVGLDGYSDAAAVGLCCAAGKLVPQSKVQKNSAPLCVPLSTSCLASPDKSREVERFLPAPPAAPARSAGCATHRRRAPPPAPCNFFGRAARRAAAARC